MSIPSPGKAGVSNLSDSKWKDKGACVTWCLGIDWNITNCFKSNAKCLQKEPMSKGLYTNHEYY